MMWTDNLGSYPPDELPEAFRAKWRGVVAYFTSGEELQLCCGRMVSFACAAHKELGLYCLACLQFHLETFHSEPDFHCDNCGRTADNLLPLVQSFVAELVDDAGDYYRQTIAVQGWGLCYQCLPRRAKLEMAMALGREGVN